MITTGKGFKRLLTMTLGATLTAALAPPPAMGAAWVGTAGPAGGSDRAAPFNGATDCSVWVEWHAQVEFEGTSGAAEGSMGCGAGIPSCEVNTDEIGCTLEDDDGEGDLICDIVQTEDGTFHAQIECEDPIMPDRYIKKSIEVEDGIVVDVEVELGPLLKEVHEVPSGLKVPGSAN